MGEEELVKAKTSGEGGRRETMKRKKETKYKKNDIGEGVRLVGKVNIFKSSKSTE